MLSLIHIVMQDPQTVLNRGIAAIGGETKPIDPCEFWTANAVSCLLKCPSLSHGKRCLSGGCTAMLLLAAMLLLLLLLALYLGP